MKILFYRYNSICEPSIIGALSSFNIDVHEIMEDKSGNAESAKSNIEHVQSAIESIKPDAVFSINFFPMLAKLCHIYGLIYIAQSVDCPVMELFDRSMQFDTNRIFLFDKAQYMMLRPYNPSCIFYLPLGSDPEYVAGMLKQGDPRPDLTPPGIAMVGSLYSEKNPYGEIKDKLLPHTRGFIDGLIESQKAVYGYNFIEKTLPQNIAEEIHEQNPMFTGRYEDNCIMDASKLRRFTAAHYFLEYELAQKERFETLSELSRSFKTDLYTNSDTKELTECVKEMGSNNFTIHEGVKTLTQMPIVFNNAKINLNITLRAIETGLPLRMFDICAAGGFLLTNYQEELPEYFEIGKEAEYYGSKDELIDKCSYYLTHEDERTRIAQAGLERIKKQHTWRHRVAQIITSIWE
ncbi:spore maturation protein CgeB [Butyrivibrio fibrisolvens DSM 3071]|uniref:Spore maturation protein CgeB n=1 Tax=Butyrivibrio fibrisolvens DSM 3071 TaxID=1121131 RepID=A0A1M5YYL6_BUTFI|nr:glycosyltransferase [Butyrivibrio fibrisolvens]SHI17107.1 spore maturation protein CgeB [Butyrivibrio fibrisolvens DSM 3071]